MEAKSASLWSSESWTNVTPDTFQGCEGGEGGVTLLHLTHRDVVRGDGL